MHAITPLPSKDGSQSLQLQQSSVRACPGPACLPRGSEVVLFNQHPASEVLERVVRLSTSAQNVTFLHIKGNPLDQQELRQKLDLKKCDHKHSLSNWLVA